MSVMRLIIFSVVIISGCKASGIGHIVPAVQSHPIVRYAPFYNFPGIVRSIHAVAPAVAPAPVLPAPLPAPVLPAPFPYPVLPGPLPARVVPAPVFAAPALPAPAQFLPAPIPAGLVGPDFISAFGPTFAPAVGHGVAPISQYLSPVLPKFTPTAPAFPAPLFARSVAPLPATPFAPIVRPVASVLPGVAPAYPTPLFAPAPAPVAVAKSFPYSISPYAPIAPIVKQVAWK